MSDDLDVYLSQLTDDEKIRIANASIALDVNPFMSRHELRRYEVLPMPPQHNYRQTKRGRVPRLTPAMRAKKRELRERRRR